MSVYLGNQKVGVTQEVNVDLPEGDEILRKSTKDALNDAVGYRVGDFVERTVPQMIEKLKADYQVNINTECEISASSFTTWTRPSGWPDLDSLNLSMSGDTDFIYMTYDANKPLATIALSVTGSNVSVTRGHINNGSYVIDETLTASGTNYIKVLDNITGYPVVRVTGTITKCQFIANTTDGRTQAIKQQPVVERIAYIPHFTQLASSSVSNWGSYFLEREKISNGSSGTALTYLAYAYDHCHRLASLDISELKTPNVTNMASMFSYCVRLDETLDLTNFNVAKVTSFNAMFLECRTLKTINLTDWSTPKLTTTGLVNMFAGCVSLKYIYGLNGFTTTNCTSLATVFNNCKSLRELNLSNWSTNNVTTLANTFSNCHCIKNLDFISNWNTEKVTTLAGTFSYCTNLEDLDLSNWETNRVTNLSMTFYQCYSLKRLNITGWEISNITTMGYIFGYCFCLEELDLSNWHITNACTNIYYAFMYCVSLQKLDLPNDWDLSGLSSANSTANSCFANCWSLKRITGISNWNFQLSNSLASFFSNCYSLEQLDVSGWNVSTVTNLSSLFNCCYSLRHLDVSNWTTTACTNFATMFNQCRCLQSLNVSNFNVSNATSLAAMFGSCYSLTTVGNISSWSTSNVTNLSEMFRYCYSLKEMSNLSNWNVAKVTTLNYMFNECYSLKELTINNWTLSACTTMTGMFSYCYNLKTLTTNNWSLPKLTTAPGTMYGYCYSLENHNGLPITLNHSYGNCFSLTHDSALTIINNLPTVTTTKTITFSSVIAGLLSTEEKAIATNKNWTIAT